MLNEFFEHFQALADTCVKHCWKFSEYETKFGNRQEIAFIGSAMVLIELPNGELEFITTQTQEVRIYKHGSYMLSIFADYALSRKLPDDLQAIEIRVYGNGFQPFVGVNNVKVEAINASGTVARQSMFGDMREHVMTHIDRVRLSKKEA
jgi:hypothetical protein